LISSSDTGRALTGEATARAGDGEGAAAAGLGEGTGVGIGVRLLRVRVAAAPGTGVASALSRAEQAVHSSARAAQPLRTIPRYPSTHGSVTSDYRK
jgi:hypothetical protein